MELPTLQGDGAQDLPKTNILVFSEFIIRLLLEQYCWKEKRSLRRPILVIERRRASSAYMRRGVGELFRAGGERSVPVRREGRSVRKRLNKRGARMHPWRTPLVTGTLSVRVPARSILIRHVLEECKHCIKNRRRWSIPQLESFLQSKSLLTKSNAPLRSIKAEYSLAPWCFVYLLIKKESVRI